MFTGVNIPYDDWNKDTQWPRGKKYMVECHVLNRWKQAAENIITELILNNTPLSSNEIRWRLEKELKDKPSSSHQKNFLYYLATYRDGVKNQTILTRTGKKYSDNYWKPISSTLNILTDYDREVERLSLDLVDVNFYNSFIAYCYKQNYNTNYVGTLVKNIKSFMRWCWESGYTKNEAWRDERIKRLQEDSTTVYLNKDEIVAIYNTSYPDNHLTLVADVFVLNCCLGLRFGDLTTFIKNIDSHIMDTDKGKLVSITNEKTDTAVYIPLNPIAQNIIAKYKDNLPHMYSNQKFNEYIKEVCRIANITKPIIIKNNKGGRVTKQTRLKYSLVTSHTARRSFATNLYLAKFPTQDIMKLTGHKKEASFMRYIRAEALEIAYSMLDHEYFK